MLAAGTMLVTDLTSDVQVGTKFQHRVVTNSNQLQHGTGRTRRKEFRIVKAPIVTHGSYTFAVSVAIAKAR